MARDMDKLNAEGGPAFPVVEGHKIAFGMSLRDYFAAQALVAMGTWCPQMSDGGPVLHASVHAARAAYAYAQADAMLAERSK